MEYVITEKTDRYRWCLCRVCGTDKATAEASLAKLREKYPHKEFRIETVDGKDCWWNDQFLAN